eukprot:3172358-Pleurochrysis_carterae.AAC.1
MAAGTKAAVEKVVVPKAAAATVGEVKAEVAMATVVVMVRDQGLGKEQGPRSGYGRAKEMLPKRLLQQFGSSTAQNTDAQAAAHDLPLEPVESAAELLRLATLEVSSTAISLKSKQHGVFLQLSRQQSCSIDLCCAAAAAAEQRSVRGPVLPAPARLHARD